ncbi:ribosome recycling factor [Candidatus Campbellbacteria bacterium]|nr:MAG: ribosome recycling factor [Candidatus Campbellbacteria bacterium]
MAYNFSDLKKKTAEIQEWLSKELSAIHTGRASVALLDTVRASAYGSFMPITQLANMSVEDARTIRIAPWDSSVLGAIDKALREANLGVSVATDDKGIRVSFPDLTTETREKYVKLVGKKMEEARISIRGVRDEVWNDIQTKEKGGAIGEDEKFRAKEEMEKLIKEANEKLEELARQKEENIRS